jgi:3-phosphoglycerate kinase
MKYLSQIPGKKLSGKTVLLRLDLNIQGNELGNSLRLKRSAVTIIYLLQNKCSVVILSHKGRPDIKKLNSDKKYRNQFSLNPIGKALAEIIGQQVHFIDSSDFKIIEKNLANKRPGEVFLVENLRFWKEEEKNDAKFAGKLSKLGDVYVNDAFAVSHRSNASVDAITKFLSSYAGLELESEIEAFRKVLNKASKPLILVIGGVKISDKIGVIKKFISKAEWILTGGGVANTFFAAKRIPVGKSVFDVDSLALAKKWSLNKKILLPDEVVVDKGEILDIGQKTIAHYSKVISSAKTVIWNGPMGMIENPRFQKGTLELVKALRHPGVFSIVGGGETTSLILEKGLSSAASFLSVGGGAMLEYLSGKKLPGVEALKRNKKSL